MGNICITLLMLLYWQTKKQIMLFLLKILLAATARQSFIIPFKIWGFFSTFFFFFLQFLQFPSSNFLPTNPTVNFYCFHSFSYRLNSNKQDRRVWTSKFYIHLFAISYHVGKSVFILLYLPLFRVYNGCALRNSSAGHSRPWLLE